MMAGKIIVAFDEQHRSGFRHRPVAREVLTLDPVTHWGQTIVSAMEGIDDGLGIPAGSMVVFSKIVAVRRSINYEYVLDHISLPPVSSIFGKRLARSSVLSCGLNAIRLMRVR